MIITLTGFMGCGKSRIGFELARKLGLRHVDLDGVIVQRCSKSIEELFNQGESAFRAMELASLRAVLSRGTGDSFVLSLGGGTLTIPEAMDLVQSQTIGIYLRASVEQIRQRVGTNISSRPLFSKDFESLYQSRKPLYEKMAFIVDTDNKTPRLIVEEIVSLLRV